MAPTNGARDGGRGKTERGEDPSVVKYGDGKDINTTGPRYTDTVTKPLDMTIKTKGAELSNDGLALARPYVRDSSTAISTKTIMIRSTIGIDSNLPPRVVFICLGLSADNLVCEKSVIVVLVIVYMNGLTVGMKTASTNISLTARR